MSIWLTPLGVFHSGTVPLTDGHMVPVAATGNVTVTLPTSSATTLLVGIKTISNTPPVGSNVPNTVTLQRAMGSSDTFNGVGATSFDASGVGQSVILQYDYVNSVWWVMSLDGAQGQVDSLYAPVTGQMAQFALGSTQSPDVTAAPVLKVERYMAQTGAGKEDMVGTIYGLAFADPTNGVQATGVVGVGTGSPASVANNDVCGVSGYGRQLAGYGGLSNFALMPGAPITSIQVQVALPTALPAGAIVTIAYLSYSQQFTLDMGNAIGSMSLAVLSQTPNSTYPVGSVVTVVGTGNATGGYFTGRADPGSGGRVSVVRVEAENWKAPDFGKVSGVSLCTALWVRPLGQYQLGAAIQIGGGPGQTGGGGAGVGARKDTGCTFTVGLPAVSDAHCVAGDVGCTVFCPGFVPIGATVASVVAGTSFTLAGGVVATQSGAADLYMSGTLRSRTDPSGTTTIGQTLVMDGAITASDVGAVVSGAGIPPGSVIMMVIPLTSFTMSQAATASGTVPVTVMQPFAPQFNYGLVFGNTDPVNTATFADYGYALSSLLVEGTHAGAAVAVDAGAGTVLLGVAPRQDAGCAFNGTNTVIDASITSADVNKSVSGAVIPPGATIAAVSSSTVVGSTSSGSTSVTGIAPALAVVGAVYSVTGTGIPAGTTLTVTGSAAGSLSSAATASGSPTLTLTGSFTISPTVTAAIASGSMSVSGISPGLPPLAVYPVSGVGIPANATLTVSGTGTTGTLSDAATSGPSTTLTVMPIIVAAITTSGSMSVTGISPALPVGAVYAASGPGITAGTTLTVTGTGAMGTITPAPSVNGTTLTLGISYSGAGSVIIGGPTYPSTLMELAPGSTDALPTVSVGRLTDTNARSIDLAGFGRAARLGIGGPHQLATGARSGDGVLQPISSDPFTAVHLAGGGSGAAAVVTVAGDNRLGFFNKSPVPQQGPYGTYAGFTPGTGTPMDSRCTSTGGGSVGTSAYTFGDIVRILKYYGLLAE